MGAGSRSRSDEDEAQTRESDTGMTNGRIRAAADPAVAMS
ncbi:hypothetical protein C884_01814 [Kocuria palustris PEL]|uniref:Uncharacterized protein n=1 Tax=Kocuria palustris PEL TaxID=1236550 RepID=M2XDX3_9MICC|nr:hypothetical protein C884_01814 [Kocuria palustris PEL]